MMTRAILPLGLLLAVQASAQEEEQTRFDAHGMYAPTGDGDLMDPLTMNRAEAQRAGTWAAWGTFEYANQPLVQFEQLSTGETFRNAMLEHLFGLHVGGQWAPDERVAIVADVPLWFTSVGLEGPQGVAMGDIGLSVPVGLLLPKDLGNDLHLGVSVVPYLNFPSGATKRFLGAPTVSGGGSVVGSLSKGLFSGGVQIGAEGQGGTEIGGIAWGSQLIYGGSFGMQVDELVGLHLEVNGRHVFSAQERPGVGTPLELALTARGRGYTGLRLHAGLAAGLTPGASAAVVRAFLGGGWTFGKDMERTLEVVEEAPIDTDQDGLVDVSDACPEEPEDFDGFKDEDGCPEADNDADGIVDTDDACPLDPEDIDRFEDEDGCPDTDNDADGFADVDDTCPDVPEDGENPNPEDGCPTNVKAVLTAERIVILDKVQFHLNKASLTPASHEILDQVAATLRDNPHVGQIRIEGHTDHLGNDAWNQDLSERRAITVRNYLIAQGVDAKRLVAKGFGETTPIATNDTEEGRELNRRVEFMVVDTTSGDDADKTAEAPQESDTVTQ